jgi:hypothetical protein
MGGTPHSLEEILREPAIVRGLSASPALDVDEAVAEPVEMGLSESLSRLLFATGLGCGSGKSPAEASSHITSLR